MRVIALAHPRSGTRYTAHCFRCAGWDVQHEQIGSDGISSWTWAVNSSKVPWGVPRNNIGRTEFVLHVMREPGAAISSIAYTEYASEPWRAKWIVIPADAGVLERAVWSYYGWNKLIEKNQPTHHAQLEQVEPVIAKITNHDPIFMVVERDKRNSCRNGRPHPTFSLEEITATRWKYSQTADLLKQTQEMYEKIGVSA